MKNKKIQVGIMDRKPTSIDLRSDIDLIAVLPVHNDEFRWVRCFWPRVNGDRELELFMISYLVENNYGHNRVTLIEEQSRCIKILLTDREKFINCNYNDLILDGIFPEITFSEDENILTTVDKIFLNYKDNPTYKKFFFVVQTGTLNEAVDYFLDHFKYKIDDNFDILIMQFKDDGQEIQYAEKLHEKVRLNK